MNTCGRRVNIEDKGVISFIGYSIVKELQTMLKLSKSYQRQSSWLVQQKQMLSWIEESVKKKELTRKYRSNGK
jgi:hypothetical protein